MMNYFKLIFLFALSIGCGNTKKSSDSIVQPSESEQKIFPNSDDSLGEKEQSGSSNPMENLNEVLSDEDEDVENKSECEDVTEENEDEDYLEADNKNDASKKDKKKKKGKNKKKSKGSKLTDPSDKKGMSAKPSKCQ